MIKIFLTIIALFAISQPVYAAPALVQSQSVYTGGATQTRAFNSNNTAGNLIIVCAQDGITSGALITPPPTISDTRGNTYERVSGPTWKVKTTNWVFIAKNIAAGANTVSMVRNGTGNDQGMHISEWSGLDTVNPFYASTTKIATSSTALWWADSLNIGISSALIYVCTGEENVGGAGSAGSGYTTLTTQTGQMSGTAYQIISSSGIYPVTYTGHAADQWALNAVVFQPPTGGPPTPVPTMILKRAIFRLIGNFVIR